MAESGAEKLEAALGAPIPESFSKLTDEQLGRLADALDAARQRERRELTEAMENGLGFVPRMLRGPVKKVLFG